MGKWLCNRCWALKPRDKFKILALNYSICIGCADTTPDTILYARPITQGENQPRDLTPKWWQAGKRKEYTVFSVDNEVILRTKSDWGFVYIAQEQGGAYKIGKSVDPQKRLLSFNMPYKPKIIVKIRTAEMGKMERELHQRFEDKRIRREWFELSDADIDDLKEIERKADRSWCG